MALKIPPRLVSWVAGPLIKALATTWRVEPIDDGPWRALLQAGRPHVFLLWHEVILPLLWHHRGQDVAIVVSANRDGQYLADFAESLGYRLVRGSSSRGATRALLGAVRELTAGHSVAFTPDGPRGPRRQMKPGVVAAAQRARSVVVPVHAAVDRAWRLNSWDRFLIPKPFAHIRVFYGQPFDIERGREALTRAAAHAEGVLLQLVNRGNGQKTP